MTYLVERLRAVDCSWSDVGELGAGAADEIERLRAELTRTNSHNEVQVMLIEQLQAELDALKNQEPVYLVRRHGFEFMTCTKAQHEEMSLLPQRFETRILYEAPTPPSVPNGWPRTADPFTYIIQHLNSNPYSLTKYECVDYIKELRDSYEAPKPGDAT